MIFQHVAGVAGIYGSGGGLYGTRMGSFSTHQWYLIRFDIHDDWEGMTISAGLVGQEPVSMVTSWTGKAITKIWTPGNQDSARTAIFDNLLVTYNTQCPSADLNGDCFVDMKDFALLAYNWLRDDCEELDWCDGADIDTCGEVGFEDLTELAIQWLTGTKI